MSVKMIADRPRKNRKREQQKRHRRKYWWSVNDRDRAIHLMSCGFCYRWVMRQVEATKVSYPAGDWLAIGSSRVHVNYGAVGEESA